MNHLVSVIVPVYNVEPYLKRCVNSILQQTYQYLEIILINDGSTDNCPEICDQFAKSDKRIKVIHKANGGLASARNAGMAIATGEYLVAVDSDDWLDPSHIRNMLLAITNAGAQVCVSSYRTVSDDGVLSEGFILPDLQIQGKERIFGNIDRLNFLLGPMVCKLYDRKILENRNLQNDERLRVKEDIAFNLDVWGEIEKCVLISECSYNYYQRGSSLIHGVTLPTKCKYILDHYEKYLNRFDLEVVYQTLINNPFFTSKYWEFGVLDRLMADVLEGNLKEIKQIRERPVTVLLLDAYKPETKKDRLFFICVKYRVWGGLRLFTKLKYYVLHKNGPLYHRVKNFMLRR